VDPAAVLGTYVPVAFLSMNSIASTGIDAVAGEEVDSHFGARALYLTMKQVLAEENVPQQMIKLICFDGCNTMSGDLKGVQKHHLHKL
jgi:hypothetical protein